MLPSDTVDQKVTVNVNALLAAVVGSTDTASGSGPDEGRGEEDLALSTLSHAVALSSDGEE